MLITACTMKSEYKDKQFMEFGLKDCIMNKLVVLSLARKIRLLIWIVNFYCSNTFIVGIGAISYSPKLISPSKFIDQRFKRYGVIEIKLESFVWINLLECVCKFCYRSIKIGLPRKNMLIENNIINIPSKEYKTSKGYLLIWKLISNL